MNVTPPTRTTYIQCANGSVEVRGPGIRQLWHPWDAPGGGFRIEGLPDAEEGRCLPLLDAIYSLPRDHPLAQLIRGIPSRVLRRVTSLMRHHYPALLLAQAQPAEFARCPTLILLAALRAMALPLSTFDPHGDARHWARQVVPNPDLAYHVARRYERALAGRVVFSPDISLVWPAFQNRAAFVVLGGGQGVRPHIKGLMASVDIADSNVGCGADAPAGPSPFQGSMDDGGHAPRAALRLPGALFRRPAGALEMRAESATWSLDILSRFLGFTTYLKIFGLSHMTENAGPIRSAVLEAVEASLHAQLEAVQRLRSGRGPTASGNTPPRVPGSRKRGRSQVSMTYDILKDAQQPLHVSEIIARIATRFGVTVDRESLVSALTKRVVRGDTFVRTGKNTFTLIDMNAQEKEAQA